jgi:hypothetical protein
MKTKTKIKNLPAVTGQAIQTAFLPATESKGERIKASCERGQIYVDYPYGLSQSEAHAYACRALQVKFAEEDRAEYGEECTIEGNPWMRQMVGGSCPANKRGYIFVFGLGHARRKTPQDKPQTTNHTEK